MPNMIGLFASSATASLVAKNGTKKIIPLMYIKSSPVDRFWCFRCLNNYINLSDMIGLFLSGAKLSKFGLVGIFVSKWLFRHLEHQNLSTGDDFIYSSGIIFSCIFGHQGGNGTTYK